MTLSNKAKQLAIVAFGIAAIGYGILGSHSDQPVVTFQPTTVQIEQDIPEPAPKQTKTERNVSPYQDRVDHPLKYVVIHHKAGAFEIVDDPSEDSMQQLPIWETCQAEQVETPGNVKVWQAEINQCLEISEWTATNVNMVINEYRADRLKASNQ